MLFILLSCFNKLVEDSMINHVLRLTKKILTHFRRKKKKTYKINIFKKELNSMHSPLGRGCDDIVANGKKLISRRGSMGGVFYNTAMVYDHPKLRFYFMVFRFFLSP